MAKAGTALSDAQARVAELVRSSYGRLLAVLAARGGDIAAAEDAIADALERALTRWPVEGIPANPEGWVLTVARNRLRDHWKSHAYRMTDPLPEIACDTSELDFDDIPDLKLIGGADLGGKGAAWVTLTPDGHKAYVANAVTNDVSVVDIKTMKEVALIPVGFVPKRNTTGVLP